MNFEGKVAIVTGAAAMLADVVRVDEAVAQMEAMP